MFRNWHIPAAAISALALTFAGIAGAAYAGSSDNTQEIAALGTAKVSLTQAIAVAEQTSGGRAINAGLNNENGVITYSVDVAKDKGVQTLFVDMNTGRVAPAISGDSEGEQNNEQGGQESGN